MRTQKTQTKWRDTILRIGAIVPMLALAACMDAGTPGSSGPSGGRPTATTVVVDGDYIGAYPSLAISPDGLLHTSYYAKFDSNQEGGGALRHAVMENGVWTVETVDGNVYDAAGDVGLFSSIAADSQGGIHIAYLDVTNGDLKYAWHPPGAGQAWQTETVDDGDEVCGAADLELNSSDGVLIGYCRGGEARLASRSAGQWSTEAMTGVGDNPARARVDIELDAANNVHAIVYDPTAQALLYTARTGSGWTSSEVVADDVSRAEMAFVLKGVSAPSVFFYDVERQELNLAERTNGGWEKEKVSGIGDITDDYLNYVGFGALADSSGRLHVAYYDATNRDLVQATFKDGEWVFETVDNAGDVGRTSAIAVDANNWIHIIYRDSTQNDLKYAYLQ